MFEKSLGNQSSLEKSRQGGMNLRVHSTNQGLEAFLEALQLRLGWS